MRRLLVRPLFASAVLAVLVTASSAFALRIAAPPVPGLRVAAADVIVVGRVVGMEDKDVEVTPFPGSGKVAYRIAVVRVTDEVMNAKGLTTIRVGFPAPPMATPNQPPIIRPGLRPGLRVDLKIGNDGLFYLTNSGQKGLYLLPMFYDFVARENGTFAKELETVRAHSKLLADPMASLKSADAEQRLLTAGLLVSRYREARNGAKTEPIAAEESKLILKVLAEANWGAPFGQFHPQTIFNRLGVTPKDGWQLNVKTAQDYQNAARAWLREHMNTYRIQRIVGGTVAPVPGGLPGPRILPVDR